jgi:hypothetical protein
MTSFRGYRTRNRLAQTVGSGQAKVVDIHGRFWEHGVYAFVRPRRYYQLTYTDNRDYGNSCIVSGRYTMQ